VVVCRSLNATRRTGGDHAFRHCERKDAAKEADRPCRGSFASFNDCLSSFLFRCLDSRGLAASDITYKAIDVHLSNVANEFIAEKRKDVTRDAAAINV
jgi:hypothetical protein